MSNTLPERGCAQDADGNLLSPSKITWYDDPDDVMPMQPISTTRPTPGGNLTAASSSTKPTLPTTLDRFLITPSDSAGARRSGRATRPSTRVIDPDNAESHTFFSSTGTTRKRKASIDGGVPAAQLPPRLRNTAQPAQESEDDVFGRQPEAAGNKTDDDYADVEVEPTEKATSDEEDVEARYASTKALGDADRKVSSFRDTIAEYKSLILI
jgi:hypothetical protein